MLESLCPRPEDGPRPLLAIVGASARAAAQQMIRLGWQPVCCDLFNDRDALAISHGVRLASLADCARQICQSAGWSALEPQLRGWMATGGLESNSDAFPNLATLFGGSLSDGKNAPNSACRNLGCDPCVWAACLSWLDDASFAAALAKDPDFSIPPTRRSMAPTLQEELQGWLIKKHRSSSGNHVRWATPSALGQTLLEPETSRARYYLQQHQPGVTFSASFLAAEQGQRTQLLGVCRQWTGTEASVKQPFTYCGSFGPLRFTPPEAKHVICELQRSRTSHEALVQAYLQIPAKALRIGQLFGRQFGIRGLFGVDFVWDGQQFWVVDLNPRFTASMELLDWSTESPTPENAAIRAKTILFRSGKETAMVTAAQSDALQELNADPTVLAGGCGELRWSLPGGARVADVPQPGVAIRPGDPVCTLLWQVEPAAFCPGWADASVPEPLSDLLLQQAASLRHTLGQIVPGLLS